MSCYCFYLYGDFTLASCTRNYQVEFEANSDWLRFGFHGYSGKENYGIQDEMESEKQYELVMDNLAEIVGIKALDTTTRIHRFQATKAFMMYMMHAKYPTNALFAADDNRLSYSLSVAENNQLLKHGIYNMDNMLIMRTTQRFDSVKPLSICRLFAHFKGGKYFFTHEWLFYPTEIRTKIKETIIKRLIRITLIYYRYCLCCVCDFPINKK